jgi:hypothetical protein
MIVISKKKIQMILACIILTVFVFSFHIATNKTDVQQNNAVETTAVPLSGKRIIVDARTWNSR